MVLPGLRRPTVRRMSCRARQGRWRAVWRMHLTGSRVLGGISPRGEEATMTPHEPRSELMLTTNKQCLEEIEHLKARIMNMEIGWQEQTKEWIEEEILAVKEVLESLEEMVEGWSYPI